MVSRCGRSPVGVRATLTVPALRMKNYSVGCTMACDGILNFKISQRPYNAEIFQEYLSEVFQSLSQRGISGAYMVMDNVPFHKTEIIRSFVVAFGHSPIFLPQYSPFLNPIENLFSTWKLTVRHRESKKWGATF
ncbi:hypothetical protein RF11_06676 [Thelohanellus kitauei]|uniref:Tc1-like transposase DDE domain-containing protein n=1 Tax=Thelohanellus kitauei TaxID=669202 RepID=A0A0C2M3W8_THEKT|nr:hypothetical protein RF11_06676 [Thelohanellus kitauei]